MINARVRHDDDDSETAIVVGPRDILAWEQEFPGAVYTKMLAGFKLTEIYQLAWVHMRRSRKLTDGMTFAEFCVVYEVKPGFEAIDSEPDPTNPGA